MVDCSTILYSQAHPVKEKQKEQCYVGQSKKMDARTKKPSGCWAMVIKYSEYCNINMFIINIL